jgi:hypothetical protein
MKNERTKDYIAKIMDTPDSDIVDLLEVRHSIDIFNAYIAGIQHNDLPLSISEDIEKEIKKIPNMFRRFVLHFAILNSKKYVSPTIRNSMLKQLSHDVDAIKEYYITN